MMAKTGRIHNWVAVSSKGCEFCATIPVTQVIGDMLDLERTTRDSPKTLLQFMAKILSREMD